MANDLTFLEALGSSDKGDNIVLSATAKKLVDLSEFLISEAQNNLNKSGSEATGELESSIKAENIVIDGSEMSIDIVLLDRYKFIDQGVKGINGGRGKYQFKTLPPSKKHVAAIEKWLKIRGRRRSNKRIYGEKLQYSPISKVEKKDKDVKVKDAKAIAWAVATAIKKNGIKPTFFFANAIKSTQRKFKKEIAEGLKLDILNSLR